MRWTTGVVASLTVFASIACGTGGPPTLEVEGDPAWDLVLAGKYAKAEEVLEGRLQAEETVEDHRMLGDMNMIRARRFRDYTPDNLERAWRHYSKAVALAPDRCHLWDRVGVAYASMQTNGRLRPTTDELLVLPLEAGWTACPQGSVAYLYDLVEPPVLALDDPGVATRLAMTTVHEAEWEQLFDLPEPERGGYFVVLEPPVRARGVGGATSRTINEPRMYQIRSFSDSEFVFNDHGYGGRRSSSGWVRASDCPGRVDWRIDVDAANNSAVGQCSSGPVRRDATMYAGDKLKVASSSHWSEPSMPKAAMPSDSVLDPRCVGEPVGRLLVDEATCRILYDRAVGERRAIAREDGRPAASQDHARRMADVRKLGILIGQETARKLAASEIAEGLPYGLFLHAPPDISPCVGDQLVRGVGFENGHLTATCTFGQMELTFEDGMTLTGWQRIRSRK